MFHRKVSTARATNSVGGAIQWAQLLRLVHILPGRLRLRFKKLKGDPAKAAALQQHLSGVAGISRVDVNPTTGSLLLHYDVRSLASPVFLDAVSQALGQVFPDQFAPGHLSLTVKPLQGNAALADWIEQTLSPVAGIERLELDAANGTCLLAYDSHQVTRPAFIAALVPRLEHLMPGVDVRALLVRAGFNVR